MNLIFKNLGQKAWFVPILLILMILIGISSFLGIGSGEANESKVTTEQQLAELCNAVHGVSEAKVMITYEESVATGMMVYSSTEAKSILGVAVVCNGGENPEIQVKLYDIIKSLFQIPSTKISVFGSG